MRLATPFLALVLALAACASPATGPGQAPAANLPGELASPAGPSSAQPALTTDKGAPLLSWIEADVLGQPELRFSSWAQGAFGAPRTVPTGAALVRDPADPPGVRRLADGTLFAHWSSKNAADPYAHDLLVAVSRDEGATWSSAVRPHRDGAVAEHGFASVVPDAAGAGATVLWLDGRAAVAAAGAGAATALYAASWDGAAFGPELLVDARVCDCCRTAALALEHGWLAAYRDRADDETRDIALAHGGHGADPLPRALHRDGWTINACPTNGPSLARASAASIVAAWFTGAGGVPAVWAAASADGGARFGPPARLDAGAPIGRVEAAATPDGAAVVWLERSGLGAEVRARLVRPDGTAGPAVVAASIAALKGAGIPRCAFAADTGRLLVAWTDPGPPARVRVAAIDLPR